MRKGYLIDTNSVIDYLGDKFPQKPKIAMDNIIDGGINLSVINKMELLGFSKAEQDLIDFVGCAEVYMIDDGIVDRTIEIRKKHKTKLPDAHYCRDCLRAWLCPCYEQRERFSQD